MAKTVKRNRRASMRGWWKVLPFVLGPASLLMTFAHWETQRLRNQYDRIDRLRTIQELTKEIEQLRSSERARASLEVLSEKAPKLEMRERDPEQVVIVPPIAVEEALASLAQYSPPGQTPPDPTRDVVVRIEYSVAESYAESGGFSDAETD